MNAFATAVLVTAAALGSSGAAAQYLWQARDAAQASPSAPRAVTQAATQGATQPAQGSGAGLMIFIDPVTGQIRPPEHDERQALARQPTLPQFTPVPTIFAGRDGAIGSVLDPSFDSYMIAVKRADGGIDMECVPGKALTAIPSSESRASVGTMQKKPALDEK